MLLSQYQQKYDRQEEGIIMSDALIVEPGHGTVEAGAQTFTTRQAPWMKLGPTINRQCTAQEAAALSGLDFNVVKQPLQFREIGNAPRYKDIPSRRAMVREDTGEFFGVVSKDYVPVQYAEAFDFMNGVNPLFVSAGSLKGGRQGFMVVQLPNATKVLSDLKLKTVRDPHDMHVVLRTSHDLSKGIEVALMTLRHRCMNQLTLPSLTRGAPQRWAIRHIGDPHAKLAAAQTVLARADAYATQIAQNAQRLAATEVTAKDATIILKSVLPNRKKRDEQISAIIASFSGHNDFVGAEFANSGWGLVNAVDEYFEWSRPSGCRTDESRFTAGLNGDAHRYTGRTAELLLVN